MCVCMLVCRVKKSPSSLRTFNMFEGVEQPSYSQTRSRSPSPLSSTLSLSLSPETPSTSKYSPITERRSLSPQPFSGASTAKRKGKVGTIVSSDSVFCLLSSSYDGFSY